MHYLCHYLNEAGYEAWVTSPVVADGLNTPTADEKTSRWICEEGIVVYPEAEAGNPLDAGRVVRYVLNRPGFVGGDIVFNERETVFCYCKMLTKFVREWAGVLTVPVIDMDTFYDRQLDRRGEVFWVGKETGISRILNERGMREITMGWPQDRVGVAALFQTARIFYSYTDYTMLAAEARLCGCSTVVMPSGNYSRDEFGSLPGGLHGLAWGPSLGEIETAQRTVGAFRRAYLEDVGRFGEQMERFVEITQLGSRE